MLKTLFFDAVPIFLMICQCANCTNGLQTNWIASNLELFHFIFYCLLACFFHRFCSFRCSNCISHTKRTKREMACNHSNFYRREHFISMKNSVRGICRGDRIESMQMYRICIASVYVGPKREERKKKIEGNKIFVQRFAYKPPFRFCDAALLAQWALKRSRQVKKNVRDQQHKHTQAKTSTSTESTNYIVYYTRLEHGYAPNVVRAVRYTSI